MVGKIDNVDVVMKEKINNQIRIVNCCVFYIVIDVHALRAEVSIFLFPILDSFNFVQRKLI